MFARPPDAPGAKSPHLEFRAAPVREAEGVAPGFCGAEVAEYVQPLQALAAHPAKAKARHDRQQSFRRDPEAEYADSAPNEEASGLRRELAQLQRTL